MQTAINWASLHNDVIATQGYKLHCKEVYHTCIADMKEDAMKQVQY